MGSLVLGPLLRYVGETDAVIWVETSEACEVEILGSREPTFSPSDEELDEGALALPRKDEIDPDLERQKSLGHFALAVRPARDRYRGRFRRLHPRENGSTGSRLLEHRRATHDTRAQLRQRTRELIGPLACGPFDRPQPREAQPGIVFAH